MKFVIGIQVQTTEPWENQRRQARCAFIAKGATDALSLKPVGLLWLLFIASSSRIELIYMTSGG